MPEELKSEWKEEKTNFKKYTSTLFIALLPSLDNQSFIIYITNCFFFLYSFIYSHNSFLSSTVFLQKSLFM